MTNIKHFLTVLALLVTSAVSQTWHWDFADIIVWDNGALVGWSDCFDVTYTDYGGNQNFYFWKTDENGWPHYVRLTTEFDEVDPENDVYYFSYYYAVYDRS